MILQLDLFGIGGGPAMIIIGLLALLLWAAVQFRSPIAAIMWGITVITLILTSLYEIGQILFWFGVLLTVAMVLVTLTARVSNA